MDESSLPGDRQERQEAFWGCIQERIEQMVTQLIETTLNIEQEVRLAAGWNERTGRRRGYRNGSYRRRLTTPHGPLSVAIPRCREGGLDCGLIFDRYQRRIADVDRILRHAYLLGCSARATAQLGEQVFGSTLSHQTVSQLTRWLDEQLAAWRREPIPPVFNVVYLDGMYVKTYEGTRVVTLAMGQTPFGDRQVLGFTTHPGETAFDLLKDLRNRGLDNVELFLRDDSGPLQAAIEQVYPEAMQQSCCFHKVMNLRRDIGHTEFRRDMVRQACRIFRAPSKLAAVDAAKQWIGLWRTVAPQAVARFADRLADSLTFYEFPKDQWRRLRTNNPMERLIRTLRMRLRPMGAFHDVPAVERAVFGQLMRWHKIKLTHNC